MALEEEVKNTRDYHPVFEKKKRNLLFRTHGHEPLKKIPTTLLAEFIEQRWACYVQTFQVHFKTNASSKKDMAHFLLNLSKIRRELVEHGAHAPRVTEIGWLAGQLWVISAHCSQSISLTHAPCSQHIIHKSLDQRSPRRRNGPQSWAISKRTKGSLNILLLF